jgi:hypothetical protein
MSKSEEIMKKRLRIVSFSFVSPDGWPLFQPALYWISAKEENVSQESL